MLIRNVINLTNLHYVQFGVMPYRATCLSCELNASHGTYITGKFGMKENLYNLYLVNYQLSEVILQVHDQLMVICYKTS